MNSIFATEVTEDTEKGKAFILGFKAKNSVLSVCSAAKKKRLIFAKRFATPDKTIEGRLRSPRKARLYSWVS